MKFVSLTGGIGAGKSTVAEHLVSRGADTIDVDQLSRQLQMPGLPLFDLIVSRWGRAVVADDGSLDRTALGQIVFADKAQLAELTSLITPATEAELVRRASAHMGTDGVVVLESALTTTPMYGTTRLIVVSTSDTTRIARLVDERGMSESDARARAAAQVPLADRLGRADFVVNNSGDRNELEAQMDGLWEWILATPDAIPGHRPS